MAAIAARTKLQYTEEGEKSMRYFYSLENQHKTKQTIKLLTKKDLVTITETHDIVMETHAFYKNLYTAQETDPTKPDEFLNIETPKLTPNDRNQYEGHITEHELQLVLKKNAKQQITRSRRTFYKLLQIFLAYTWQRTHTGIQLCF